MKVEDLKNIQHSGVIRKRIKYNESENKKVYLTYSEAKKFSDSGKKVWVDTSNPVRPLYFVYVHIDAVFDIC